MIKTCVMQQETKISLFFYLELFYDFDFTAFMSLPTNVILIFNFYMKAPFPLLSQRNQFLPQQSIKGHNSEITLSEITASYCLSICVE